MTAARAGKGLLFQIDTTGGGVYSTVAETVSFSGLKEAMNLFDATSFDSTYVESGAALPDYGEVTVSGFWVCTDTDQQLMRTNLRAGTRTRFKVTPSDQTTPSTLVFWCYIKDLSGPEASGPNDALKWSATLRLDGQPTVTYGTA